MGKATKKSDKSDPKSDVKTTETRLDTLGISTIGWGYATHATGSQQARNTIATLSQQVRNTFATCTLPKLGQIPQIRTCDHLRSYLRTCCDRVAIVLRA